MPLLRHIARGRILTVWGLTVALAATPVVPTRSEAAAPVVRSEAVYAAFTVNLTRFIVWPSDGPSADGPFLIGTFPRDPINAELDAAVQGETINGRPIRTIRLHSLDDIAQCHVVYVSKGVASVPAVLARAEHHPILTISDADGFLSLGGHVRFVPEPSRTALQVSARNLRASGLEARAQLLRIAAMP